MIACSEPHCARHVQMLIFGRFAGQNGDSVEGRCDIRV